MDSSPEPLNPATLSTPAAALANTFDWRGKVYLLLGVILSIGVCRFVASAIQFPPTPFSTLALLQQPSPAICLIVIAVAFLVCVTAGTIIAGCVREDAGLLCGCIALASISLRGGTLRDTLLAGNGSKTYLQLALECLGFVVICSLAAGIVGLFRHIQWIRDDDQLDGFEDSVESPAAKAGAVVLTAVAYLAILYLLAQTDRKAQVLAACTLAGGLATLLAHYFAPVKPAGCFYLAIIIAAPLGYLAVYLSHPAGDSIGQVSSMFAPWARALPIDHASAGVGGSLIGYWMSRRMHLADDSSEDSD